MTNAEREFNTVTMIISTKSIFKIQENFIKY